MRKKSDKRTLTKLGRTYFGKLSTEFENWCAFPQVVYWTSFQIAPTTLIASSKMNGLWAITRGKTGSVHLFVGFHMHVGAQACARRKGCGGGVSELSWLYPQDFNLERWYNEANAIEGRLLLLISQEKGAYHAQGHIGQHQFWSGDRGSGGKHGPEPLLFPMGKARWGKAEETA